jgi:hypothetical protein
MKKPTMLVLLAVFCVTAIISPVVLAQDLEKFRYSPAEAPGSGYVVHENDFHGYTNHWQDRYSRWIRYGNLFKLAVSDVKKTILQSKVDAAEDIGLPGLVMEEGFMYGVLKKDPVVLDGPSVAEISDKVKSGDVLVFTDPASETGKKLMSAVPQEAMHWPEELGSHQYGAADLVHVYAFILSDGEKSIYVVASSDADAREHMKSLIRRTKKVVDSYDLKKGWFGAYTLHNSVTCTPGHPLEVMGLGMNEGCSWFVFDGYMDFLLKDSLTKWSAAVKLPVVTDVGATRLYACQDWDNFQIQQMFKLEDWIRYAKKKNGYLFRRVWEPEADAVPYSFAGYLASEGDKEQIDKGEMPFVVKTGQILNDALQSMVLFHPKGEPFTRESMWQAILDKREVGVLEKGKMMGPAAYRHPLDLLLIDRVFLEKYFGDRVNMESVMQGYDLQVTLTNTSGHTVSGTLDLTLPQQLAVEGQAQEQVTLPAGGVQTLHFAVQPSAAAMDRADPIAVRFRWDGREKSTLAVLDLPPAISVHRLLYGHTPVVEYPVTIHNFSGKTVFPVKVQVVDAENEKDVVFTAKQKCETKQGTFRNMLFKLKVPPGNYKVKVYALGVHYTSQLGVGKAEGKPYLYEVDLNGDGINEYRMENDSVRVTLLTTGARVIEYFVKSKQDNVLFKLWPDKPVDDRRPFRKWYYYPYGGFEDFLGQASMETHQVYHAEVVKKEGDYVRVRMWTDYYGNRLEKTFTLYGNTPLLEIRFALTFKNPEADMLGPQPMLSLGKKHGTEDAFFVPEKTGVHEFHMRPDRHLGQAFFVKEGWNAGYDTKENISFVGAFPADQPLFLHMWQNHDSNHDSHYFYAEFQPWVPIYQKSTMYFSYYLWGAAGPWEKGLQWLRQHNLITKNPK